MTLLWEADDPEVICVATAFVRGIDDMAPALGGPARELMARIARPNWTMEWYLPRWLGEAFELPLEAQRALMRSNVVGLAYVRLQDDLADGEPADQPPETLAALSAALYTLWIEEYLAAFGGEPAFWRRFRSYMAQWIGATLLSNQPGVRPAPLSPEGRLGLARRGAPLKICGAGACLMAGREDLIVQYEATCDHLLAAAVLFDHALDWETDLAQGRYNAFVAYTSDLPQDSEHLERNRQAVAHEMYVGQVGRPYFAAIYEELQVADEMAQALACNGLRAFLAWLDEQARATGAAMTERAQAHLAAVVALLTGAPADATLADA